MTNHHHRRVYILIIQIKKKNQRAKTYFVKISAKSSAPSIENEQTHIFNYLNKYRNSCFIRLEFVSLAKKPDLIFVEFDEF